MLLLTPGELTRDPRARRAAIAATEHGLDVIGVCGQVARDSPVPLDGIRIVRVDVGGASAALRRAGLGGMQRSRFFTRELRGLWRLARLARLSVRLVRAAGREGRFDVIHANDLDTLPAAWLIAARTSARLIYDAHELYTDQEPNPPRLHRAVAARLEGFLARRADAVTTVSDLIAEELRRRLRLHETPRVVLNCPRLADVTVAPPTEDARLAVVYQGAMGPGRPLDDLLVAAERAPTASFTLRIAGADSAQLRAEVERRRLANLEVVEPVPPDRLVEALGGFEVGLVINRPVTKNDELVLPNKVFEYLMAGLAVVAPRLSGLEPLVDGGGVGLTFEPGNPDDLARALTELSQDRDRVLELRRRARTLAEQRFNAESQTDALLSLWTDD